MTKSEQLLRSCFCCSCDRPMSRSLYINVVNMHLQANWDFPTAGNVLTGQTHSAVAIICDECMKLNKKITKVVELRGDVFIYHAAADLQPQEHRHIRGR